MISMQDTIKDHTLVVNEGSGVLVQPMTKEYSYVVTAKHVIQNDKDIPENGIMPIENITIYTSNDQLVEARFVYIHPTLDLAIILVDYMNASIRLDENHVVLGERLIIFGYPNYSTNHRNKNTTRRDWIETYTLDVLDVTGFLMKLKVTEDVQLSDFEGFSGGGFFKVLDDKVYLVGIDYKFVKSGEY
ncbi:MAG: trypsin-like peptidase domain-containing protein, partial [Oleispira antarctica]|nr:trypsin-like peptidase domain-containing protein [Oleispira antarctica]